MTAYQLVTTAVSEQPAFLEGCSYRGYYIRVHDKA